MSKKFGSADAESKASESPSLAGGKTGGAARQPDEAYPIRIARDGTWYHAGRPISRIALVKLFASVLRCDEAGDFWLITPAERGRIAVEDTPFVAVDMTAVGEGEAQVLTFRTNLGDEVVAGPEHPIGVDVDPDSGQPKPYILVRDRLEARIGRSVYYDLVERGSERDLGTEIQIGVWSDGTFFPLGTIPGD